MNDIQYQAIRDRLDKIISLLERQLHPQSSKTPLQMREEIAPIPGYKPTNPTPGVTGEQYLIGEKHGR